METEYHIASYVVRTRPEHEALVADQIKQLPGLEVHASEHGKLVVTAEADSTRRLAELAGALELMDMVLQLAPVYHEFTSEPESEQTASGQADAGSAEAADKQEMIRSQNQ
jgi:nitrate reductase NapD